MATTIAVPAKYGWVLLSAAAIGFQCFTVGFFLSHKRSKYFSKELMEENFKEEHKTVGDYPLPKGGYPDQGNGRYSQKLSYKAWFDFNNSQRVHQNFVENIGVVIPATLIAGLRYPQAAAIAGAVHFIGRFLYALGYTSEKGGDKREAGAVLSHASTMWNIVLSLMTAVSIIKGI